MICYLWHDRQGRDRREARVPPECMRTAEIEHGNAQPGKPAEHRPSRSRPRLRAERACQHYCPAERERAVRGGGGAEQLNPVICLRPE